MTTNYAHKRHSLLKENRRYAIYAKTSPRLLREIPKFFKGFNTALNELFQNAYKAQASSVVVEYDEDKMILTISDDGKGLADPRCLIIAGETGWDKEEFMEPAGMGVFSLLHPEYVRSVIYKSFFGNNSWEMTVDQSMLEGVPVQVMECDNPDWRTGFIVQLFLGDEANFQESMIAEARSLYPYLVTFTSKSGAKESPPKEIHPINEWKCASEDIEIFDTIVGILEYTPDPRTLFFNTRDHQYAVWEYRKIKTDTITRAISGAVSRSRLPDLASVLFEGRGFRWHINPYSGVSLKSDRNDLLDDHKLQFALDVLVEAVVSKYWEILKKEVVSWPDKIIRSQYRSSIPEISSSKVLNHCLRVNTGEMRVAIESLLNRFGWRKIKYMDPSEFEFTDDNNCLECEISIKEMYIKNPQALVTDEILSNSLNMQGISAAYSNEPTVTEIVVTGLKISKHCPWVAFADNLNVPNIGSIKYLFSTEGSTDWSILKGGDPSLIDKMMNYGTCIIYAGSRKEFIDELRSDQMFCNLIAMVKMETDSLSDWEAFDSNGHYILNDLQVKNDVEIDVIKAFDPNLSQKRKNAFDMDISCHRISVLRKQIAYEIMIMERIKDSQTLQYSKHLKKNNEGLEKILEGIESVVEMSKVSTAL